MRIVIAGGSGQVGTILGRAFRARGDDVAILSRNPRPGPWRTVVWDGATVDPAWAREVDGADVVINLAGRSVNCRYNARNRREILRSRIEATRAVGQAIAAATRPAQVWLQASTATIYAHRYEAPNDEYTGIIGGSEQGAPPAWRFSIEVATTWEAAAAEFVDGPARLVVMRSAMIMSPDRGGVFDRLATLVRRGVGGPAGNGNQYVSWVHDHDFIAAVLWLIQHSELAGAVNIASPNPLPNAEFMRELRRACGIRIGLPAPDWLLEIGAFFLRTESELILKSRRVVPQRLLESGFVFAFPQWSEAAPDLCRRWCKLRSATDSRATAAPAASPIDNSCSVPNLGTRTRNRK